MARILRSAREPAMLDRLELEARDRARAIVAEAEDQAARTREAAEVERDEVLRAAAEAGREDARAHAAAGLAGTAAARGRRLEALEGEVAAVALEVARTIVGEALALRPELVVALARRALERVRSRREIALRVHPDDAPLVQAALPRLAALLERSPGLTLREDPGLCRGGVVVETETGRVDARVEAQLALLERALGDDAP